MDKKLLSFFQQQVDFDNAKSGTLDETDGYKCNKCKNKGWIARLSEQGSEIKKDCECMKIRDTLKRAQRSGLGNILSDFTFEKFNDKYEWQKDIKSKAKAFCADDCAKWFFIGGQPGSGKTHLCTAISAFYIKAGYDVRYMIWREDGQRLKALANSVDYTKNINYFKSADVLYIDDFLKTKQGEQPTAADINLAFEIINHRLINSGEKITIISSEKLLSDILNYDEATASRIYQLTGDYKIYIPKDSKKNFRITN